LEFTGINSQTRHVTSCRINSKHVVRLGIKSLLNKIKWSIEKRYLSIFETARTSQATGDVRWNCRLSTWQTNGNIIRETSCGFIGAKQRFSLTANVLCCIIVDILWCSKYTSEGCNCLHVIVFVLFLVFTRKWRHSPRSQSKYINRPNVSK